MIFFTLCLLLIDWVVLRRDDNKIFKKSCCLRAERIVGIFLPLFDRPMKISDAVNFRGSSNIPESFTVKLSVDLGYLSFKLVIKSHIVIQGQPKGSLHL